MAQPRKIASNLQMDSIKIPLNTGEKDKLYWVAGGAIYEIPIPEHGNLDGVIADGIIVDIGCREAFRIPGRSRRKR